MLSKQCRQLLRAAAVESLERVRRDRARAPARLKPVFAYLERHLFDPTLSVGCLSEAVGIRDSAFSTAVRSVCGQPPRRYIEDRRFDTACRLLAGNHLRIWQIGELVGFPNPEVFARAFRRWAGQSPSRYRKEARKGAGGGPGGPAADGWGRFSDREWLGRALAGQLPAAEARGLIERLSRLYPSSPG